VRAVRIIAPASWGSTCSICHLRGTSQVRRSHNPHPGRVLGNGLKVALLWSKKRGVRDDLPVQGSKPAINAGLSGQPFRLMRHCPSPYMTQGTVSITVGSSCVPGTRVHQESDQGPQQRLTAFPNVMNELEDTQIEWQLLLRDPPVRAQPRPQQGPDSSIRIATSPVRWSIPKTGGFSLASVPRPRSPFNRRRRPGRPFFSRPRDDPYVRPRLGLRRIPPRR